MSIDLSQELDTYERHKDFLLEHYKNQFVVIKGDCFYPMCTTYEIALAAGYEKHGTDEPFLVKQIRETEPVATFSRDISPAEPATSKEPLPDNHCPRCRASWKYHTPLGLSDGTILACPDGHSCTSSLPFCASRPGKNSPIELK